MNLVSILSLKLLQDRAIICAFRGDNELVARLQELGLRIGSEVYVIGRAPFRGPLLLRLGTTVIALREEEANCLQVEVCV